MGNSCASFILLFTKCLMLLLAVSVTLSGARTSRISDVAFPWVNARATKSATEFDIYKDQDTRFNKDFWSGWFGVLNKIHLNSVCVYDEPLLLGHGEFCRRWHDGALEHGGLK